MVEIGQSYLYAAPQGLAELHVEGPLHPEMRDLDLRPDTPVKVVAVDDDRGLVLVEWVDASGNPRITSVEPGLLGEHFIPGGGE